MNPSVIIYETKKKRLSKEQAFLFYRKNNYITVEYFYRDWENNGKWTCYGGVGFPADTKTRLTRFPTLISSCLKQNRARKVKRFYALKQVKEFTKNAHCDCLYWWDNEIVTPNGETVTLNPNKWTVATKKPDEITSSEIKIEVKKK